MEKLFELLGLSTPFLYAAGTYSFFHWLDANASDEAKVSFARVINANRYNKEGISAAIVELFDKVYTYPLLTRRAFVRSSLITIFITGIYVYESHFIEVSLFKTLPLLIIFVFSNILSDFISLFVTRHWLVIAGNRPIFSLIASSLIFLVIIALSYIWRSAFFVILLLTMRIGAETDVLADHFGELLAGTFIYFGIILVVSPTFSLVIPALIVFLWLPLFGISLSLVRGIVALTPMIRNVQWFLKGGDKHVLIAVGYLAAVIVFLGTLLWRHLRPEAVAQHAIDYGTQLVDRT
jgi:hypothetical protein